MVHSVLVAPFSSTEEANIAFNTLRVDPEPRKSLVSKQLSVDQNQLIAYVYVCMYGKLYVFVCAVCILTQLRTYSCMYIHNNNNMAGSAKNSPCLLGNLPHS